MEMTCRLVLDIGKDNVVIAEAGGEIGGRGWATLVASKMLLIVKWRQWGDGGLSLIMVTIPI